MISNKKSDFDWTTSVFHSAIKKMTRAIGWLQVVRIYSFMKETKLYKRASHIAFLFVKSETNKFIKEIKYVIRAFIAW